MTASDLIKFVTLLLVVGVASPQVIAGGPGESVPVFYITAPVRARYDTPTTFSVSAAFLGAPQEIHLHLRTGFAFEIALNETQLFFDIDEVQTWSVVIDSQRMVEHQQSSVQLIVEYDSEMDAIVIPMDPHSGFIMIQTDKVIYTPRQTVMYRVLAVDDDQRFAEWPLTIDIQNPDMVILERQHHTAQEAFDGRNFTLPRDATTGTWSITAYYVGTMVQTRKTVTFDVKEYVLPTFKVEVSAVEKVIVRSTASILVNTKAMYSYGQPVQGQVQLRLGVAGTQNILLFNNTYSGTLNSAGEWSFLVPVADMHNHSAWFPDGSRLFINANVTEDGTGEVGTAASLDTLFANYHYQITFTGSKTYFKPGFPYNLVVDVKAANGDPASNLKVFVIVEMRRENGVLTYGGFSNFYNLDAGGRLSTHFDSPSDASALRVHVYALEVPNPTWNNTEEFLARKFNSPTGEFLHLDFTESNRNLVIRHARPEFISPDSHPSITVLILARGRLIHSASVRRGDSDMTIYTLSQDVLVEAAPSARVVAYYYVGGGDVTGLVTDSLVLDVPDACREELELYHGTPFSQTLHLMPKQETQLQIRGGPDMRVGLLAVDQAVYFLRDESSLTRDKMFGFLGEADEGRGIGDGMDADTTFEYAGLQFVKLERRQPSRFRDRFQDPVNAIDVQSDNILHAITHHEEQFRVQWALVEEPIPLEEVRHPEEQIPLEEVRKFFPESWLFKEVTLPGSGFASESITLPDSITTWAFTAVGVGAHGGVCMSHPLELVAFKPFFAQVRLPYKVVRLEEVTIDIGIYNYQNFDINMTVTVRGDIGLCFSEGQGGQQAISYGALLRARRTNTESLRVIPLVAGSVSLVVDVRANNGLERDTVEKTLHVVAEGRRVQKSITFPLDPTGLHSSHQTPNRRDVLRTETASITNMINQRHQKQLTDVMLFMPVEVIQGSERCQISACGDLMGDILSTAVLEQDNLFESSVLDAEEAIGNLAPVVHALLYLNRSNLMTPLVQAKGQAYVIRGVSRLLTYRKQDGSFSLTRESPSATWLTALVLKTLCQAEQITFIDRSILITQGFQWLLNQVTNTGILLERDRRLARQSRDYDLILSAETIIALQECTVSQPLSGNYYRLKVWQQVLLAEHFRNISSPLVMAKTAYALSLFAPRENTTQQAVQRLLDMRRTNVEGLQYWSVSARDSDPPNRPFWYHSSTKASTIEATAYALLVFALQDQMRTDYVLEDLNINLDSIAGWLIQKRNSHGAFIGAMDTAAATQALSEYSLSKQGLQMEVDLQSRVTTSPVLNFTSIFDFDEHNAILPKSLSNVPVGRQLRVRTQGTGLGQMQVRVEYNIPVDANADCRYNVSIRRHAVDYNTHRNTGDEVCDYCNMDCDNANSGQSNSGGDGRRHRRQFTASRVSICLEVCIRSADDGYADRTILDVNMLSGFEPVEEDLDRIYNKRESLALSSVIHIPEKTSVEMKFNQVSHYQNTCVSFRAIEKRNVQRRNPAIVTVRAQEDSEPTCVQTYDPVISEVNLAVYCASDEASNQGQCRCFSGLCGTCRTRTDEVSLNDIQNLVCSSKFIYKLQQTDTSHIDEWMNITAEVINISKDGSTPADAYIHMVTPRTCPCPNIVGRNTPHYFFGSHVDIFVDRNNVRKKTYVVDHTSTFVSASFINRQDPDRTGSFISMAMRQQCND